MATTWSPRMTLDRKSWLLASGEVVHEPPLEETPSGKKVRVAGTELSVYAKDVDSLIRRAVGNVARQKQTLVWMPLANMAQREQSTLGFNPTTERAQLHFVHDPTARHGKTHAWWKFKHPALPIEAMLVIKIEEAHSYGNQTKPQTVSTFLVTPQTRLDDGSSMEACFITEEDEQFCTLQDTLDYDSRAGVRKLLRDNPPSWDTSILGSVRLANERVAVEAMIKKVRTADKLAGIQILDLRDPLAPAWLDLDLFETNCNSKFIADLADYLDGAPTIEQAAQLYTEMLRTLRSIGIVMEGRTENDFMAALLSGDKAALTVSLGAPQEEGHDLDKAHKLTMHLPTGTFVVECSLHAADRNTVAEKWDEALMMAQFTGQEDELLTYAKEYAKRENKARTTKILRERKTGQTE